MESSTFTCGPARLYVSDVSPHDADGVMLDTNGQPTLVREIGEGEIRWGQPVEIKLGQPTDVDTAST